MPPPFQILNQTRPGTRWRLKCSNWLVINTAWLLNKIVPRLKLDFRHPPSPSHPSCAPTHPVLGPGCGESGSAAWHPDGRRESARLSHPLWGAGKRAASERGSLLFFCPSCRMFCLLEYPLVHSISFIHSNYCSVSPRISRGDYTKKKKKLWNTKSTWPILSTFKYWVLLLLSSSSSSSSSSSNFVILPSPHTTWSIINIFFKSNSPASTHIYGV